MSQSQPQPPHQPQPGPARPQARPAPQPTARPTTYGPPPARVRQQQAPAVPAIAYRGHYARHCDWYVLAGLISGLIGWVLVAAGAEFGGILIIAAAILLVQSILGVVQNIQTSSANIEYLAHASAKVGGGTA